jgi:hypothetical protein
MTSKLQNISDDWGWFIDIEHNSFVRDYYLFQRPLNLKKPFTNFKVLPVIKEDESDNEYDYYINQYNNKESRKSLELVNTQKNNIFNNKTLNYYNHIYLTSILTLSITSYILINYFKL